MILRSLFGFTGTALTDGAVKPIGDRTDPAQITAFLDAGRGNMLDADDNGNADALTDGIVILRYLFGFTGTSLTHGAVDPSGNRTDPTDIEAFLSGYMPAPAGPQSASPAGTLLESDGNTDGPTGADAGAGELLAADSFAPSTASDSTDVVSQPEPIDPANGLYDPPPEAADAVLGSEALSEEPADPLDPELITASYGKRPKRSAVDVALESWTEQVEAEGPSANVGAASV